MVMFAFNAKLLFGHNQMLHFFIDQRNQRNQNTVWTFLTLENISKTDNRWKKMFEQLFIEYVKALEAVNVITENITIRFKW